MIDAELIRIASNTENHGAIDQCTHSSKLKNPICGDEMKIYLIIKSEKIINFKYMCESCIFCQASVSLLSRKSKNKSILKVKKFLKTANSYFEDKKEVIDNEWKDFKKIMTKKNIARKECLLLPLNATLNALNKKTL